MLPDLGVIVCTQGSTVAQRVRGLRLGADDWIAKPAHPEEVMARIEAVVRRRRRSRPREDAGPMVAGEIEIRADQFQAFVSGHSLELTRREFELLQVLAEASGRVIEREEIYQRVWGYAMAHGDRSVDVFIRKLRAKLAEALAGLGVHPHPLRRRLPLRARAAATATASRRGRPLTRRRRTARTGRRAGSPSQPVAPPRLARARRVHTLFTPSRPRRNKLTAERCECARKRTGGGPRRVQRPPVHINSEGDPAK